MLAIELAGARGMVGMGMIVAHDIEPARPCLALRSKQRLRADDVAVVAAVGAFVVGGDDTTMYLDTVEVLNPRSPTFVAAPSLIEARGNFALGLAVGGNLVVALGTGAGGPLPSVELLAPGAST